MGWLNTAVDPKAAQQALVVRYLAGYGPATPEDFATWSGIPTGRVRGIWKGMSGAIVEVPGPEGPMWVPEDRTRPVAAPPGPRVHLLPSFDPYLMGYRERRRVVPELHHSAVFRSPGWVAPIILLDGRVTGTWGYKRRLKRLAIHTSAFPPLGPAAWSVLEQEAVRVGEFLGLPAHVQRG
ncbi:MAG: DNA glycosylase AlkZ-like family protein [Actinomycetota bacterium]